MRFLPRRVIGLVLIVYFAGTPSLLLACAVTCEPGAMTHSAVAVAASSAAQTGQAPAHDHMHHGTTSEQSAADGPTSPRPDSSVAAANAATPTDAIGRSCCNHADSTAAAATTTTRPDLTGPPAPATLVAVISVAAGRDVSQFRGTRGAPPVLASPTRSPLVLRI